MLNLFGKIGKLCCILCIRPTGSKLTGDGMFRNGGNCRNHLKTSLLCGILQFYQCILIGAVAIDTHKNRTGAVALYLRQALRCGCRDPAAIRRHREDSRVLFCKRVCAEIGLAGCQINRHDL